MLFLISTCRSKRHQIWLSCQHVRGENSHRNLRRSTQIIDGQETSMTSIATDQTETARGKLRKGTGKPVARMCGLRTKPCLAILAFTDDATNLAWQREAGPVPGTRPGRGRPPNRASLRAACWQRPTVRRRRVHPTNRREPLDWSAQRPHSH